MGHTVLAIPVPALDSVVRERTAFYDPSFVSTDPNFAHAPRFQVLTERDVATAFPDGVIHLRPEPDEPFRKLTASLAAEFFDCPPYAGEFADPAPHLTLDHHQAGGVSIDEVRERVALFLPVTFPLARLDLQWWADNDCRLLHSWPLGVRA